MAGTAQEDSVLFWRLPKGCWWYQPFIPEPGFGPALCHDKDRAHMGCKCCAILMDPTGATHPCSSALTRPGVQDGMPDTEGCLLGWQLQCFPSFSLLSVG